MNALSTVRNDTQRMRQHMRDRVKRIHEGGLDPNSHPLTVAEGLELAVLIDQVMAIVAWHGHDSYDRVIEAGK